MLMLQESTTVFKRLCIFGPATVDAELRWSLLRCAVISECLHGPILKAFGLYWAPLFPNVASFLEGFKGPQICVTAAKEQSLVFIQT